MSYEVPGFKVGTQTAAADLSAKQFYAVQFSATGIALAGAGERIDGVLQDKPESGDVGDVMVLGVSKAVAGDAILKGAAVTPDANGKFVTAASGNYVAGTALEAAAADGDIIAIVLDRGGRVA